MSSPSAPPAPRSRWPLAIALGLGVVITVNVAFFMIASRNPPVIETDEYYDKALHHQVTIDAQRASAALGWQAQVSLEAEGPRYTLKDATGQPVAGLKGSVALKRNETTALDARAELVEGPPGTYQARTAPLKDGIWRLEARFEGGPAPWLDTRSLRLP